MWFIKNLHLQLLGVGFAKIVKLENISEKPEVRIKDCVIVATK